MLFWALKQFFRIVRQSIILSLLFVLSTIIAVFIFYVFYQWYLPKPRFERSVDFELQNVIYKQPNREIIQHELVSTINLFDKASESLHYGQEYHISLVLEVPESDNNFDIGMFGITADILDSDGRKSVTYKTMGTLIYKSFLLRCMTTIVYFPYYMFGRFDQKQTITLTLKDNYVDNAYMPANRIILRVHDKLQYYSVNLIIEAKFSGLRYCLHRWYYTTSVILCFCLTSMIYLAFLYSFFDVSSILFGQNKITSPKGSDSHFDLKAIEYDDDSNETKFSGDLTDEDIRELLRAQNLSSKSLLSASRSKKIEDTVANLESWSRKWLASKSSFEMPKNEE